MVNALFVSSLSERYYYDDFIQECRRIGVRVGVLDPEHFIRNNLSVHVDLDSGFPAGYIDLVELGDDKNTTWRLDIEDIHIAWYLRVNRARRVRDIKDDEERFRWNETLCALESFLSVLQCPWVNTFESIDRLANNKLLQQLHAHNVGLRVPRTRLSNDSDRVIKFSEEFDDTLLLKSIGSMSLGSSGNLVLYSELFSSEELKSSELAIRSCPIYGQEYMPKRFEYRIMYIGGRVLACQIDSQASSKTIIDWRNYDFDNVAHKAVELPPPTVRKIADFMNSVSLNYGALDLIETPAGNFVFLEVNPSGQWGWIAQLAELPVAKTVANMLKYLR